MVQCIKTCMHNTLAAIIRSPYLKIRGKSENKASSKAKRGRDTGREVGGEEKGGCDGGGGEGTSQEGREWRKERWEREIEGGKEISDVL